METDALLYLIVAIGCIFVVLLGLQFDSIRKEKNDNDNGNPFR